MLQRHLVSEANMALRQGALFAMPSGVATFIAGPMSSLYFVTLVVAGFLFNFRLSVTASVVAAGSYQLCCLLRTQRVGRSRLLAARLPGGRVLRLRLPFRGVSAALT